MISKSSYDIKMNIITSNPYTASRLLGIKENPEYRTLSGLLEVFEVVTKRIVYSSKLSNTDEFTGMVYTDDDEIVWKHVVGCDNLVRFPGGRIVHHRKNTFLFDCAQLYYYISNKLIPICYTSLATDKLYKVKRSDGSIQDSIIKGTQSIRPSSSNGYVVCMNFNKDSSDTDLSLPDLTKDIYLDCFMLLNDISHIDIRIPFLEASNYDLKTCDTPEPVCLMLIDYFNDQISHYTSRLKETIR